MFIKFNNNLMCDIVSAYGNLGSVLSGLGRYQEAEMAFHEALRHRPNMADVHYNL